MFRLNRLMGCIGVLGLAFMARPAHANLQVMIIDSLGSITVKDTDSGQSINAIKYDAADGDFTFNLEIATSNSPGSTLATLHIDSIVQASSTGVGSSCAACGAGYNLKIIVSDNAFTMPIGTGNVLAQAVDTNTNPLSAATGKATFNGYQVNGGAIFATGANSVGPTTFNSFDTTNSAIQMAGPYTSTNPFALTEVLQLNFTNTNQGQATANLAFGSVPEPSTIMLMGTIVLGLTAGFRKKLRRS